MVGMGAMFLAAIPLSWISHLVNPVYPCAIDIHATAGVISGIFDQDLRDSAWRVK